MRKIIAGKLENNFPNVGPWEIFFFSVMVIVIVAFIVASYLLGSLSSQIGTLAIATVTAVGGFVAIFRLRRRDVSELPTVRPSFNNANGIEFGIKNFQPGPALHFQLLVHCPDCDKELVELKPEDEPMHLEEGEFVSLTNDEFGPKIPCEEGTCIHDGNHETLHFYYTYTTKEGIQIPHYDTNVNARECLLEERKEEGENPRSIKYERILNLEE